MDCREVEERGLAEAYVAGRIEPAARDAFEEHYFGCDDCLARIEACSHLRRGLSAPPVSRGRFLRGATARWWPLGVAASFVLTAVAWWVVQTSSPAPDDRTPVGASPTQATPSRIADLGRFDAPAYRAAIWRGSSAQAWSSFEAGMQRYLAHDYRGAIPDLRRAAALSPAAPEAHFFLGVSLLLAHDVDAGIVSLEHASALGDTPYLEPTLFYLTKGYLLKGDRPQAERQLKRMIALKGDLEPAGRGLLAQLEKSPESRP
jgi:hypothetical protein